MSPPLLFRQPSTEKSSEKNGRRDRRKKEIESSLKHQQKEILSFYARIERIKELFKLLKSEDKTLLQTSKVVE